MIPIGDDLPTLERPWMTWLILGVTFAVWILYQQAGANPYQLAASVCNLGLVPAELTHAKPVGYAVPMGPNIACLVDNSGVNTLTPLTSMFLHGSWGHILGNSLFFWIFGNNIEDSMGHWRFLVFYLVCGLIAAATHVLLNAGSAVPTVGASGAISGVLGAYLVLYPRTRVRLYFPPIFFFSLPAVLVLVYWFVLQVLTGIPELTSIRPDTSSGVAVWAHVGGFVAGVVLIRLFEDPRRVDAHRRLYAEQIAGRRGRW